MSEKGYSGDLIRVVMKAFEDEEYEIGDLLEVESRMSDMGACDDDVITTVGGYILHDEEYEVIKKARLRVGKDRPKRSREDIFDRLTELQYTMMNLSAIVQNEGSACDEELLDWCERKDKLIRKLNNIEKDIIKFFS